MKTDIKFYITESLFSLLDNKKLEDIKITELSELSNVSRGTFYNNFHNLYDVIDYKLDLIIEKLFEIYNLNKLRNKNTKELFRDILIYIEKNKKVFLIIRDKLYFIFKNKLDNYFINILSDKFNYYIISGIIINLSLYYLDHGSNINTFLDKIKID